MRTQNRNNNLRPSTLLGVTMILFLSLVGMFAFAPSNADTPPELLNPVTTQVEALKECERLKEWPQMEMECRQAAFNTAWPENAGNIAYPR